MAFCTTHMRDSKLCTVDDPACRLYATEKDIAEGKATAYFGGRVVPYIHSLDLCCWPGCGRYIEHADGFCSEHHYR